SVRDLGIGWKIWVPFGVDREGRKELFLETQPQVQRYAWVNAPGVLKVEALITTAHGARSGKFTHDVVAIRSPLANDGAIKQECELASRNAGEDLVANQVGLISAFEVVLTEEVGVVARVEVEVRAPRNIELRQGIGPDRGQSCGGRANATVTEFACWTGGADDHQGCIHWNIVGAALFVEVGMTAAEAQDEFWGGRVGQPVCCLPGWRVAALEWIAVIVKGVKARCLEA